MVREVSWWMPLVPQGIRAEGRQIHVDDQPKIPPETDDRTKLTSSRKDHALKAIEGVEKADWYEFSWLHDWFLCLSSKHGTIQRRHYE